MLHAHTASTGPAARDISDDTTGLRDVDNRIPVRLITGIAGAGKTAFLRGMMTDAKGGDQAYVVADRGIFEAFPQGTVFDGEVAELATGAICFAMQNGDLTSALNQLHLRRMGLIDTPVAYCGVVVEIAADIAPLHAIYQLLTDSRLALTYRFDAIIAVVDGVQALAGGALSDADADIVARADMVVVTKADHLSPAKAATVNRRLAAVNPFASRSLVAHGAAATETLLSWDPLGRKEATLLLRNAADMGAVDVTPPSDGEGSAVRCLAMNPLNASTANEPDPRGPIQALHMVFDGPADVFNVDAAAQSIAAIAGSNLIRMKWVAATPKTEHSVVFQYIDGRLIHPTWGPPEPEKQVRATIVGRDLDRTDILQRFSASRWALNGQLPAPF